MRGTVLAQIVGFLILPLLTRHFAPEAFAHFQIFQSFLSLMLVVATMRYEIALLRANDGRELGAMLMLCLLINLSIAIILFSGNIIYYNIYIDSFQQQYGFPFYLLLMGFIFGGFAQYFGYFLNREKLFSQASNSKVGQSIANAGTATGFAFIAPMTTGIIIGDIVGRAICSVIMFWTSISRIKEVVIRPAWADVLAAARKFREYPFVAVPGGLINMAGTVITPIMIYRVFDAATSGQFALLDRAAGLPLGLITVAISQVYMAQLAEDFRKRDAASMQRFRRLIVILSALGALPVVIVLLFAGPLFHLIFGPGWGQAAFFARLMLPAYFFALVSAPINMTLIVVGRLRVQVIWEAVRLVAMIVLWIGGPRLGWSIDVMVASHSILQALFSAAMVALAGRAVHQACAQPSLVEGLAMNMDGGE